MFQASVEFQDKAAHHQHPDAVHVRVLHTVASRITRDPRSTATSTSVSLQLVQMLETLNTRWH